MSCRPQARCPEREAAKAAGLGTYFTGEPCKHGHISPRWVSNSGCVECKRLWDIDHPRKHGRFVPPHAPKSTTEEVEALLHVTRNWAGTLPFAPLAIHLEPEDECV